CDRDGGRRGSQPVAGRIDEGVGAVVVGAWRIGEAAVGVKREAAVGWTGDDLRGERVAVRISVVVQHALGRSDDERSIFVSGVSVVCRGGRHVNDDRQRGVGEEAVVAGRIRYAVGAVKVRGRDIVEAAVIVEVQGAVGRTADGSSG